MNLKQKQDNIVKPPNFAY